MPADLHRRALDRLHHAVMMVDTQRRILYANAAMCQYMGMVTRRHWTPDELIGMDVMAFHPHPVVPGTDRRFHEMQGDAALGPRTNAIEDLMFMTWDSRICDESGEVVAYLLEKVPATFNPDPLPHRSQRVLAELRDTLQSPSKSS
jgi:PAS domain-containing protein